MNRQKTDNLLMKKGFSLPELVVIIAIIGILAAIAIPSILKPNKSDVDKAVALRQIRDMQGLAVFYQADMGVWPTIEQLDEIYFGRGSDTVIGRYQIVSTFGDDNRGHGNDWDRWDEDNPGNKKPPENLPATPDFIIYTTHEIGGVNYVYGFGDSPPKVAYADEDPLAPFINH